MSRKWLHVMLFVFICSATIPSSALLITSGDHRTDGGFGVVQTTNSGQVAFSPYDGISPILGQQFLETAGSDHSSRRLGVDIGSTSVNFTSNRVEVKSTSDCLPVLAGSCRPVSVFSIEFDTNSTVQPTGVHGSDFYSNWFIGNEESRWRSHVNYFSEVSYEDLWDGIDVVYRFDTEGRLKYDVLLDPGADLSQVEISYKGINALEISAAGHLRIQTDLGWIEESAPISWQPTSGGNIPVDVQYRITETGSVGYEALSPHDSSLPLIVDPLLWSTFLGSTGYEGSYEMATDALGNIIIVGTTTSSNFPVTSGAYDQIYNSADDVFVANISANGSQLNWATFLGGSGTDDVGDLEIDSLGNILVTGMAASSTFPTTSGAYDQVHSGGTEAFVVNLSSDGSTLHWSTYLGGTGGEGGDGIDIDESGNIIVGGSTSSTDFPTTSGAYNESASTTTAVFISNLSHDGGTLQWSTYVDGSGVDRLWGLELDGAGNVIALGTTSSANFHTTSAAYDQSYAGSFDIFVANMTSDGSGLHWSTLLGETDYDIGTDHVLDSEGNILITGYTSSTAFPVTGTAFDQSHGTDEDMFVSNLSSDGSSLLWSTFLGATGHDVGGGITLDQLGNAIVTGSTDATDFPITNGSYDQTNAGGSDLFVTNISSNGSRIYYSTFIGGTGGDGPASSLALTSSGNAIVAGHSTSTNFPTTNGAYDQTHSNGYDVVVAILELVDADLDGRTNSDDAFPSDPTQWNDTDSDGLGDNSSGNNPDDCPTVWGNSTIDQAGCPDNDGDGYSNNGDDFPDEPTQWDDADGDGTGDNGTGVDPDNCPSIWGNATWDLRGCPDSDGDGLSDGGENSTFNTQWDDNDTDNGGVYDGIELFVDGTDPLNCSDDLVDLDGDGYIDGEDAFPSDPTQWNDTDGDGYGDNSTGNNPDAFPNDPSQWEDSDGDGYGDNATGNDPDRFPGDDTQWNDTDGDGYGDNASGNNADDCWDVAGTSWQDRLGCLDTDGDGWSDYNDWAWADSSQWADSDGDGFGDNSSGTNGDQCPLAWGTDQNLDGGSVGCPDSDGDGISDVAENGTYGTAWDDPDSDGGGVSDGEEVFSNFTGPLNICDDVPLLAIVTSLVVMDRPGDLGGHLSVQWDAVNHVAFGAYDVFVSPDPIADFGSMIPELIISDAGNTSVNVSTAGGMSLIDGWTYHVAVSPRTTCGDQDMINFATGSASPQLNLIPGPVSGVTAVDVPDDDGSALEVQWDQYTGDDFASYRVYLSTSSFASVSGMTSSSEILVIGATSEVVTMANGSAITAGTNYWVGVTIFSDLGVENTSVSSQGPFQAVDNGGSAADLLGPVSGVSARDVAEDLGGWIEVFWDQVSDPSFDRYAVYLETANFTTVQGTTPNLVISDSSQTSVEIATLDGVDYWVAVVAVNVQGLGDLVVDGWGPVQSVGAGDGGDGSGDGDGGSDDGTKESGSVLPLVGGGLGGLLLVAIVVVVLLRRRNDNDGRNGGGSPDLGGPQSYPPHSTEAQW